MHCQLWSPRDFPDYLKRRSLLLLVCVYKHAYINIYIHVYGHTHTCSHIHDIIIYRCKGVIHNEARNSICSRKKYCVIVL